MSLLITHRLLLLLLLLRLADAIGFAKPTAAAAAAAAAAVVAARGSDAIHDPSAELYSRPIAASAAAAAVTTTAAGNPLKMPQIHISKVSCTADQLKDHPAANQLPPCHMCAAG
jgi:hypothetical protein